METTDTDLIRRGLEVIAEAREVGRRHTAASHALRQTFEGAVAAKNDLYGHLGGEPGHRGRARARAGLDA